MVQSNIFIFGMPRTGTTLLQSVLSKHFQLPNLKEPLAANQFESAQQMLNWVKQHGPAAFKILAGQPYWDQIDQLLDADTKLFVCLRKNLTDSCISLHVAKRAGRNHYNTKPDLSYLGPIEVPLDHVHYWLTDIYRPFYYTVKQWRQQQKSTEIYYEDLINNVEIDVGGSKIQSSKFPPTEFVNAEISYANLCSNYKEVHDMVMGFCP